MRDEQCVDFLQWALPRLRRRWRGFRKVRRTTCKRIDRRLRELALPDIAAYRAYLEREPQEWQVLEALLPITISRFYRDAAVFDYLGEAVLPDLAERAAVRGDRSIRAWSIGCASGEEPYSLVLLWRLSVQPSLRRPMGLSVLATDVEAGVLERARIACYARGSLKQLPRGWLGRAFVSGGCGCRLRPEHRAGVAFERRDVCGDLPAQRFDLIMCRNLVFTYFERDLQAEILRRLVEHLRPGGGFVIGRRETLPDGPAELAAWSAELGIYSRSAAG